MVSLQLTDDGICSIYNSRLVSDSFDFGGDYLRSFNRVFHHADDGGDVSLSQGAGNSFSMDMVLDTHYSRVDGARKGRFRLALNSEHDFFAVRDSSIFLRPGTKTSIRVEPALYEATEQFKALPVETRKCMHREETFEGNRMKYYTMKVL